MVRLQQLVRNKEGATALEFAFVAPILFLFLLGILEFSLIMFTSSVVEGGTAHAARLAKTGDGRSTAKNPNTRKQQDMARIKRIILDRGGIVLDPEKLNVAILSSGGDIGKAGEVVTYSATYEWKVRTPMLAGLLTKKEDDSVYPISSIAVVVNEPFEANGS